VAESRIEELRRRVGRDPGSRLFAQLSEEERRAGNLNEAIRVARAGLAQQPAYPAALLTLGRALMESGDGAGARDSLQEALRQAPDNILASRLLGQALEALGELQKAVGQYRATLRMAPEDGQLQERVQALEQRLAGAPRTADPAGVARVSAARASQGPLAALPERAAVRAEPAQPTEAGAQPDGEQLPFSSPTLAELYLRQGFAERAVEVYRQLVAERPGDERARARLAELASQLAVAGGGDAQELRRQALQRAITGLEALLGVWRRR